MSRISTHVLDTSRGQPATGIEVTLHFEGADGWKQVGQGMTDTDGRIENILDKSADLPPGDYRLSFATAPYFHSQGLSVFYPEVQILIRLNESRPFYHLPLLLNPYGYSTYRGS